MTEAPKNGRGGILGAANNLVKTLTDAKEWGIIILLIGLIVFLVVVQNNTNKEKVEYQSKQIEIMVSLQATVETLNENIKKTNQIAENTQKAWEVSNKVNSALVNLLSNTPILRQLR